MSTTTLLGDAAGELEVAFGTGATAARALAPGRCTLVGEHVDYVGGRVLAMAVDLHVAVAARVSADGVFRLSSRGRRVQRTDPAPAGDAGDRAFATVVALRRAGVDVPPVEVGVAADLPEGAGLASSAAVLAATADALLGLTSARLSAGEFAEAVLTAERDIVGVPCGPLDPQTIVFAHPGAALLLDCAAGSRTTVTWPWSDVLVCVCDTGEQHDVGGAGYAARRRETERALALLGVSTCQDVGLADVEAAALPAVEGRRARHAVAESRRAQAAAKCLQEGDAASLGALMSESHVSLRDLLDVSTPALEAVVGAARAVPGCHGARLVGAGFGGAAIALVERAAVARCRTAMAAAVGAGEDATWVVQPSPGVALLSHCIGPDAALC